MISENILASEKRKVLNLQRILKLATTILKLESC